jgi:hypothetical protein
MKMVPIFKQALGTGTETSRLRDLCAFQVPYRIVVFMHCSGDVPPGNGYPPWGMKSGSVTLMMAYPP